MARSPPSHDDSQLLDELEREIGASTPPHPQSSIYRSTHSDSHTQALISPQPRRNTLFGVDDGVEDHPRPFDASQADEIEDLDSSATPQPFDSLRRTHPTALSSDSSQLIRGRQENTGRFVPSVYPSVLQSTGTSTLFRSRSTSPPVELLESLRSASLNREDHETLSPQNQGDSRNRYTDQAQSQTSQSRKGKERVLDGSPGISTHDRHLRRSLGGSNTTLPAQSERNEPPTQTEGVSDDFSDPEYDENEALARPGSRKSRGAIFRRDKRLDPARGLSDRQKALWTWVNVVDLDGYLQEVYEYYIGQGIYCIALRRILNLLTYGFVIIFSTFLFSCIDFSRFPSDGEGVLRDVIIDRCISRWSVPHILITWVLGVLFAWQIVSFSFGLPRLLEMKRFYDHLLNVPNDDIQTISWPEIVRRIGNIRQDNPITSVRPGDKKLTESWLGDDNDFAKLDAHDVANRILRQENYLIALFNKDLLDLRVRVPLPTAITGILPSSMVSINSNGRAFLVLGQQRLTKALEWNLRYCLMGHLFDHRGRVRKDFVRGRRRGELAEQLSRRFIFMGILNAIFAPFIVIYIIMYSFFRYFEEYHKNPSSIGSRQYTLYAKWKFREFNELPHLFDKRLDESYPAATKYINQFPKEINAIVMRFVAFISGAFAAVLLLLSVIDPVFLRFQITHDRTVLFYLGLFTSILAVARGLIPENSNTFEPEALMAEVIRQTHYMPDEWKENLHSKKIHEDFGKLFDMKLSVFLQELLSVVLTPFILWFSLPLCARDIVDFFREFTIHVDGIGFVCSFAVFDFKRQGNIKLQDASVAAGSLKNRSSQAPPPLMAKESKMEKSLLHFKITNPDWQPSDPSASMFLDRVAEEGSSTDGSSQSLTPTEIAGRSMTDSDRVRRRVTKPQLTTRILEPPKEDGDLHMTDKEKRLRDRSMMYERALQRSIMLKSSSGASIFGPGAGASSTQSPSHQRMFLRQEKELSRLRGKPMTGTKGSSKVDQVDPDAAEWELSGRVKEDQASAARALNRAEDSGDEEDELDGVLGNALREKGVMGLLGQALKR